MSTKRQTDEEDAVSEHHTQWSTGAAQVVPAAKSLPATAGDGGDLRSVPGLGRSPAGGHGNTPQYSCLENPMDRGALKAIYSLWDHKESDNIEVT